MFVPVYLSVNHVIPLLQLCSHLSAFHWSRYSVSSYSRHVCRDVSYSHVTSRDESCSYCRVLIVSDCRTTVTWVFLSVNNNIVNALNNNAIVTAPSESQQFMPAPSSLGTERSGLLGDHNSRSASMIEAAMSITELGSTNHTPYYQHGQCVPLYSQYYSESELGDILISTYFHTFGFCFADRQQGKQSESDTQIT